MNLELAGKVCFVAGASRGIGLGIAEVLLAEGARVALAARGSEALKATHAVLVKRYGAAKVWSAAGDLSQTGDIERILAACESEFGALDGAVANVGVSPSPLGYDVNDDDWQAGLDQNLNSGFRLARAVLARMTQRKSGALLFISSIAGIDAMGSPLVYATTKAAMNQMGKALARMWPETGVRVNTIAPGNIIFPGGHWEGVTKGPRAEAFAHWIKREVPMRRYGTPEEIGNVAAFLLSPRASFVHGATIVVDGGQTR